MNKFIYIFAILGSLALSTAQIVEPDVSNNRTAATDNADEAGILTPFEDYLPVDGDSDYFKNGEDYGGIYEGYFEDAEGFVGPADNINDDFGSVEAPIVAEEHVGLVDVPEPLNEEGFVGLPDALIQFEEEATVNEPEAVVGKPEPLIDVEEGKTGSSDDFGEVGYPDDLVESDEDFSEAFVDYPDNLAEAGEDVSEAFVDSPDALIESEEDSSEAQVDTPDDLFESGEGVTVDIPEAYVGKPEDITEAGEVEDITDAAEVDQPDDITDAGFVDEPDDITDAGEVDKPEDPKEDGEEVELDPRVLDTNGQGYAVQLDDIEQDQEKSKNFLG